MIPPDQPGAIDALAIDALARARAAEAAGAPGEARRWYQRVLRLKPADPAATLAWGLFLLRRGEAAAEPVFAGLVRTTALRPAWLGLAGAQLLAGDRAGAARTLARLLARFPFSREPDEARAATAIARAAGAPGWCGVDAAGRITLRPAGPAELLCDGRAVAPGRALWRGRTLTVRRGGRDLLGSPLDLAAIRARAVQAPAPAPSAPAAPASPRARAARRALAEAWLAARRRRPGAVVLVRHAEGGGVARHVGERAAALAREGLLPIVLEPGAGGSCAIAGWPDLRYALPRERESLARLLRRLAVRRVEFHHLLGHHPSLRGLAAWIGAPYEVFVHDYALLCPRITLIGGEGRYCGEPGLAACETCRAALGSLVGETPPSVAGLRAQSAAWLARARRVVVPAADVARRLARHFPGLRPEIRPWEEAAALPPPRPPAPRGPRLRVAVVGAVGVEKGFAVLAEAAEEAARGGQPIEFVLVGHSIGDARLIATGRVFVTGPYAEAEAEALVREQEADLAFLPSLWPETWSYALGIAWRAGLAAAVFDIGAPAERVRARGGGFVLPLGLSGAALNRALLALAGVIPCLADRDPWY
ncbi:MAG: glycosyltransferase [Acetobacteraceae bacterium]